MPLLLLSKSQPLRWVVILFLVQSRKVCIYIVSSLQKILNAGAFRIFAKSAENNCIDWEFEII